MEKSTQQQRGDAAASHLQKVTQMLSVLTLPILKPGFIQHNDTECFKKLSLFIQHYIRRIGPEDTAH